MASTSARRRSARGPAAAAQTFLPDEIWEDILLRLDAAAHVARASAACSTFRRIVSARRFLRRFRSLRPPAILGFIGTEMLQFFPAEPPHRSAPQARALEQAADFTFSFLPDPRAWRYREARDGRVLLSRRISASTSFEDLDFVVCDPLHRRYVKIPRIPDDLLPASTQCVRHLLPVLAPADENDEEEWFRIICTVHHTGKGKVMAFVFSSCNQAWQGIISTICLPNGDLEEKPYYAHGCLYCMFHGKGYYSLRLDTSEMKFSIIDLAPHNFDSMMRATVEAAGGSRRVIVEAADGRLGFLTMCEDTMDLYSKNRQSNGAGAQEWQHDKLIPLPKESGIWYIVGTVGRYVALVTHDMDWDEPVHSKLFVLDTKTLLVEKLCTSYSGMFFGFPYARFPPPLALPSI